MKFSYIAFSIKSSLILLFVLVLLFACGTTSMMMTVKRPAEINLKGYDKIAIGNIVDESGRISVHSNDISDKITETLFTSGRFDVLDRQHLNNLIEEHKLGVSGFIDESSAAELGKFIGSAVLVFGRIQSDKYDEETSKGEPWTDKKGNRYQNFYRKGKYTLAVNLKVVDVQTAKILAVKTLNSVYTKKTSATNKAAPQIDSNNLYRACMNDVSSQFLRLVAPYDVRVEAEFEKEDKIPEIEQALLQFKIGEWDEGIKLLSTATEKKGLEPKILAKAYYNLGLAEMYTGKCEEAIEHLKKALSLNPGSSRYQKAIVKAKDEKTKADKLKEQGT